MRRKLFVICILLVTSIRADIINGDTDPLGVPRDLSINKIFAGYDTSQTTSIRNHILTHLSGDNLRMLASTSLLHLHNVSLELDGTYTFTHGSIKIVGKVEISGSGHKFRFASHSLSIADGSELIIGPGVEFEFAPTSSLQTAVRFDSDTSKLTLNSSTLTVNNNLGMHLVRGNLSIVGNSIIDNVFTDTHKALVLGINMSAANATGDGDCKLSIKSGAKLTVKKAGVIFKNNGVGGLDASDGEGTLVVDTTGNFLFESLVNLNNMGISLGFSKLQSFNLLGDITGLNPTPVAEVAYNAPVASINFSSDGKYLAIAGGSGGAAEEVAVYRFDGSSLTKVAEVAYNVMAVNSVDFSPDGKYLAVGSIPGSLAAEEIAVFRFDGSSLIKVAEIDYNNSPVISVNFSPDGKYLAIAGFNTPPSEEVEVYRFDGSSLTKVAGIAYNVQANSVNFSPDGKYLAAGRTSGATEEIEVYRFNGSSLTKVAGVVYNAQVNSVNFSPDGRYLAVGGNPTGDDEEIVVYRFDGSSLTNVAEVATSKINSVDFSPDGKYLAVGRNESAPLEEIEVYRFDGSSLTKVAGANSTASFLLVNFLPDSKHLATVGFGGSNQIVVFEMNFGLREKLANMSDGTIHLSQNLKLENITLKTT